MRAEQVNEKSGDVKSSSPLNVTASKEVRVVCGGGGGPLGHPQVWLNISSGGKITCPYCSRIFVKSTD